MYDVSIVIVVVGNVAKGLISHHFLFYVEIGLIEKNIFQLYEVGFFHY
jgi:hypothetical protein